MYFKLITHKILQYLKISKSSFQKRKVGWFLVLCISKILLCLFYFQWEWIFSKSDKIYRYQCDPLPSRVQHINIFITDNLQHVHLSSLDVLYLLSTYCRCRYNKYVQVHVKLYICTHICGIYTCSHTISITPAELSSIKKKNK